MKLRELSAYLGDLSSWQLSDLIGARVGFAREMRRRRYGREETRDAWAWYLAGFIHGHGEGTAAAIDPETDRQKKGPVY